MSGPDRSVRKTNECMVHGKPKRLRHCQVKLKRSKGLEGSTKYYHRNYPLVAGAQSFLVDSQQWIDAENKRSLI